MAWQLNAKTVVSGSLPVDQSTGDLLATPEGDPSPPLQRPLRRRREPIDPQKLDHDLTVLYEFIRVYCRKHHDLQDGILLCDECYELFEYARKRRERCPYDPKPACKDCPTHCYRPDYRQRIKTVMRFSGMYYVKRGRIDWMWKYFFR